MKTCNCTCGHEIDLNIRDNIEVIEIEKGYKYSFYEYYAVCPICGDRQIVQFSNFPFRTMWRLYREYLSAD